MSSTAAEAGHRAGPVEGSVRKPLLHRFPDLSRGHSFRSGNHGSGATTEPVQECVPLQAFHYARGSDEMETTQLQVSGMICDACAGHVEKSLRNVAGVRSVRIDRAGGRATVEHVGAEDRELIAAVADAGY